MELMEILVILIVALLVVKPKDLPTVARKIGLYLNYLKNLYRGQLNDYKLNTKSENSKLEQQAETKTINNSKN